MALALLAVLGGCGGHNTQASATQTSNTQASSQSAGPASPIPTLAWQEPATREDGSSLAPNEIGGYRVYYKQASASVYKTITLTDPNTTNLTLSGFSPGNYDFYVTAVDTSGLESPPSKTVAVNI